MPEIRVITTVSAAARTNASTFVIEVLAGRRAKNTRDRDNPEPEVRAAARACFLALLAEDAGHLLAEARAFNTWSC